MVVATYERDKTSPLAASITEEQSLNADAEMGAPGRENAPPSLRATRLRSDDGRDAGGIRRS